MATGQEKHRSRVGTGVFACEIKLAKPENSDFRLTVLAFLSFHHWFEVKLVVIDLHEPRTLFEVVAE
jgi:hypothetical protein